MALEPATPPPEGPGIVTDALTRLATIGGGAADAIKPEALGRLGLASPHPVYLVDTVNITSAKQLAGAKLVAWRYLILDLQTPQGGAPVGAVELACDPQGKNLKFASFNVGPFVLETMKAINAAEQFPDVQNGSYELRGLRMPSVYVMALWLKNKSNAPDSHDMIVPMQPAGTMGALPPSTVGGGLPGTQMRVDDFFRAVSPAAQSARITNSAPDVSAGGGAPPGH